MKNYDKLIWNEKIITLVFLISRKFAYNKADIFNHETSDIPPEINLSIIKQSTADAD